MSNDLEIEPAPVGKSQLNGEQKNLTKENSSLQVAAFTAFSGPIPPPSFLLEYEKLVPGIAKKFLEGPHIEAQHRRSLEKRMVEEQVRLSKRGQWMAFSLASLCVFAAFTSIFLGFDLAGVGALFVSVASFVGVFIYAKTSQR